MSRRLTVGCRPKYHAPAFDASETPSTSYPTPSAPASLSSSCTPVVASASSTFRERKPRGHVPTRKHFAEKKPRPRPRSAGTRRAPIAGTVCSTSTSGHVEARLLGRRLLGRSLGHSALFTRQELPVKANTKTRLIVCPFPLTQYSVSILARLKHIAPSFSGAPLHEVLVVLVQPLASPSASAPLAECKMRPA